jgi:hypothetical protein
MSVVRWKFIKNLVENFSFENEDQVISGLGELWTKEGTPTLSISTLYKKHGISSQKIVGTATADGISQIIDVSEVATADFALIFYTYIVTGTLSVKVETLDVNDAVLVEVFSKTYSANSVLTKQSESFTASGSGYTQLKITISQSGATVMTSYIDAVILYEDVDTTVEINPTQFSYSKASNSQFIDTIENDSVKVTPLEDSKRTKIENFRPIWAFISATQKALFEAWVGEDLVIIHDDDIFHLDLLNIDIGYLEKQVPSKFEISMEFAEVRR